MNKNEVKVGQHRGFYTALGGNFVPYVVTARSQDYGQGARIWSVELDDGFTVDFPESAILADRIIR